MFIAFREEGRQRNTDWSPPVCAPTKGQSCNLGVLPDWESNPQPFGVQDEAPTHWATQSGE